jgi:hypothetical protein
MPTWQLGKFLRLEQHKYLLTKNSGILSGDIFKNSVEFIFVEFKIPTCIHAKCEINFSH